MARFEVEIKKEFLLERLKGAFDCESISSTREGNFKIIYKNKRQALRSATSLMGKAGKEKLKKIMTGIKEERGE